MILNPELRIFITMELSHLLPEAKLDRYVAIPTVSHDGVRGHGVGPHTQWQWQCKLSSAITLCIWSVPACFLSPLLQFPKLPQRIQSLFSKFSFFVQVGTWADREDRESHTALSELYRKKSVLIRKTVSFEDGKYRSKNLKKIFFPSSCFTFFFRYNYTFAFKSSCKNTPLFLSLFFVSFHYWPLMCTNNNKF